MPTTSPWPVLTRYDNNHLARIALPLGGIGTGTVSIGGRGDLRDWEIVNRPAKGFAPEQSFFALYLRPKDGKAVTRALEGPIEELAYEGGFGSPARNHGLPRFRHYSFEAAYPLGQVLLSDPDVPVTVRIQAFNPLIPANSEESGIPTAIFQFMLTNNTAAPISAAVCGSVQNFIGMDGSAGAPKGNVNTFRREDRICGVFMHSDGVDPECEQWGTLALTTPDHAGISYRTAWAELSWGDTLLDFWDDFSEDGKLEDREKLSAMDPMASLAVPVELGPGETVSVTFLLTWHFPNRMTWSPAPETDSCCGVSNTIGNFYTTRYRDAWDVAVRTLQELPRLEEDTLTFVRTFCESDLPPVVKEAALYNLSTLRTQTCFRTADGRFYGWEGCGDKSGCCDGSCTHVWNYEQATAFLFSDLSRSMREVEFLHATRDDGHMSFRVHLPLERAAEAGLAAADGQMGCLMKLYRDWTLSGDEEMLRRLWPRGRKALEFCWIPGGWDADQDGIMEGCQHNTMDVEYDGPNGQMGGWYLGALRAAEEMARFLGETDFAANCRQLFENGRAWMDKHLFNGEYYEHHVWPPKDEASIAPGLRVGAGAMNLEDPELQLGAACLVDQLVGQFMAHVCGLGYLLDEGHVGQTLRSVMRYNFQANLHGHFNHLRTFALGEESALLMATYPRGRRPRRPFPYYNEVMTGFEYTAAVGMLYEGQTEAGLRCMEAVRGRYDGAKRSPFDEAECGHHYARAMASWAAVLALTGFHYSAVTGTMQFKPPREPTRQFWSTGSAWGLCIQTSTGGKTKVEIQVLYGELSLQRLILVGFGTAELDELRRLTRGESVQFVVTVKDA